MMDLTVRNVRVIGEGGEFFGGVTVKDGTIVLLGENDALPEAAETIDGHGMTLLPGGIDPHVHIRYPGGAVRETFLTGTRAAAAGGVTTIVEHPISTPPQYNPQILKTRTDAVTAGSSVDVAFLGAAGGEHLDQIERLADCGVVGYKTFLHAAPEGRETEFAGLTSKNAFELRKVMRAVARTGLKMAAHGEDNDLVSGGIASLRKEGRTRPIDHAHSRPPIVEVMSIDRLIRLAEQEGVPLYLVHLSTPEAVETAVAARRRGMDITIETCPQYLYLTEEALEEHGAYAKCNPALRERSLVDKMWDYIADGSIDTVGSDHAPYTVQEKESCGEDIFKAPAGFPGLETRMGLMLKAVTDRRISLKRAAELLSTNPAKAYGLYPRKGAIRVGADADFVLVDLDKNWTVDASKMETMSKGIARVFNGWVLPGRLESVWLRGRQLVKGGNVVSTGTEGRPIRIGGVPC